MSVNHEIQLSSDPDIDQEKLGYAPEKLEGIDRVAANAVEVLKEAMGGSRRVGISETDRGLQGIVEAPVPDGNVAGFFEGDKKLDRIVLSLSGENGKEHIITIDKPESGSPMLYLDGTPANAEDLPSVAAVIEQIKVERQAIQSNETPESAPIDQGNTLDPSDARLA